jgi:hypothetical protein
VNVVRRRERRSPGHVRSARSQQLETTLGQVRLSRLGYKVIARKTRYPLDERLNLPSEVYSHPLRRRA